MKIIIILLIISLGAIGCGNKSSAEQTTTELSDNTESVTSVEDYKKALGENLYSESASLKGLELFKNSFTKNDSLSNDKALKVFLEYQSILIDSLNSRTYNHSDFYEKLNTLINEDSTTFDKEAVAYEKVLIADGFKLSSSEGSVYIDSNPDVISNFFMDYLSSAGKQFYSHYAAELNRPYAEDGGIIISLNDIGDRLLFWDDFSAKHPDYVFTSAANNYKSAYLDALLLGMDNTSAYDYDSKKWSEEFLGEYKLVISKSPQSGVSKILNAYLQLLSESEFMYNEKVQAFADQYRN
jgi:hypothetical protein